MWGGGLAEISVVDLMGERSAARTVDLISPMKFVALLFFDK